MHINGTDCHDFLSVAFTQFSNQHGNEGVQLLDLFLEVIFQGVFITFLQTTECDVDLSRPPNLGAAQSNLKREVKTGVILHYGNVDCC